MALGIIWWSDQIALYMLLGLPLAVWWSIWSARREAARRRRTPLRAKGWPEERIDEWVVQQRKED